MGYTIFYDKPGSEGVQKVNNPEALYKVVNRLHAEGYHTETISDAEAKRHKAKLRALRKKMNR